MRKPVKKGEGERKGGEKGFTLFQNSPPGAKDYVTRKEGETRKKGVPSFFKHHKERRNVLPLSLRKPINTSLRESSVQERGNFSANNFHLREEGEVTFISS